MNKSTSPRVKFLKVFHGDSILISIDTQDGVKNILIDGGPDRAYKDYINRPGNLSIAVSKIVEQQQKIDLLIVTHIDNDHIGGIVKMFADKKDSLAVLISEIWFNSLEEISKYIEINDEDLKVNQRVGLFRSPETSFKDSERFDEFIKDKLNSRIVTAQEKIVRFDCTFSILSPDLKSLKKLHEKWINESESPNTSSSNDYEFSVESFKDQHKFIEDNSVPNSTSISFLFEYCNFKALFLGDSLPSVNIKSLKDLGFSESNKLKLDYIKLSHHGSKSNLNEEFLRILDCINFVVSTDGSKHSLPNKECLSLILNTIDDASIYFNYPEVIERIFTKEEISKFKFKDASQL